MATGSIPWSIGAAVLREGQGRTAGQLYSGSNPPLPPGSLFLQLAFDATNTLA